MRDQASIFVRVLASIAMTFLVVTNAFSEEASLSSSAEEGVLLVELKDERIRSLRVEMFDAVGREQIFDSGILDGQALEIDLPTALGSRVAAPLRLELRAWDALGDLVLSQISTLPTAKGVGIVSINFETIPAGTRLVSDPISLEGDVEISAGLDVAGAVRTSEIRSSSGGTFFGSCTSGSSIRSISPNGTVTCEAGSGGDNLGNHTAQQDVQMSSHAIQFSSGAGLRASGGGEVKTGPQGQTFQFFSGGPSADIARFKDETGSLKLSVDGEGTVGFNNGFGIRASGGGEVKTGPGGRTFQFFSGGPGADIARFKDETGSLKLSVTADGGINFDGGQKICSAYDATGRNSVVASAGWTASTCSAYRGAVAPTGDFQLACVFRESFSFGGVNGGPPPQNCGW